MTSANGPIDFQIIRDMLYNDESYVDEFCEASVATFSEFQTNFRKNLLEEDLEQLRRTGHKIKPVAKMLKLDPLLEMYERAKELLTEGGSDKEKQEIADKMDNYVQQILDQLKERAG